MSFADPQVLLYRLLPTESDMSPRIVQFALREEPKKRSNWVLFHDRLRDRFFRCPILSHRWESDGRSVGDIFPDSGRLEVTIDPDIKKIVNVGEMAEVVRDLLLQNGFEEFLESPQLRVIFREVLDRVQD